MSGLVRIPDGESRIMSASDIEQCTGDVETLTECINMSNDALDNLEDQIDRASKVHGAYRIKIERIKGKLRKLSNDL